MYRQSQEQILVNQSNGAASQPNMAYQPVMFNTTGQVGVSFITEYLGHYTYHQPIKAVFSDNL